MDSERLYVINAINECFGEAGWSFSISNVALDYVDKSSAGHYSVGTSSVIRVQRPNGIFREDVGYGFSDGTNKADVICRAKKNAVTDGLRGAVLSFGGEIARKISSMAAGKTTTKKADSSSNIYANALPQTNSLQASGNQISASRKAESKLNRRSPVAYQEAVGVFQPIQAKDSVAPTSPVMVLKQISNPSHPVPIPRVSPPLATPLPQLVESGGSKLSEEELAKIERKKRQKMQQEEFRKMHLLEQAQAQAKVHDQHMQSHQIKVPSKEQEALHHARNEPSDALNLLEVDDDVLLSTQDIEAMVEIAADTTNLSRRAPILSSPSIARAQMAPGNSNGGGLKRPDLGNFAFQAEKRSRGPQT